jgi:hypothetical protein
VTLGNKSSPLRTPYSGVSSSDSASTSTSGVGASLRAGGGPGAHGAWTPPLSSNDNTTWTEGTPSFTESSASSEGPNRFRGVHQRPRSDATLPPTFPSSVVSSSDDRGRVVVDARDTRRSDPKTRSLPSSYRRFARRRLSPPSFRPRAGSNNLGDDFVEIESPRHVTFDRKSSGGTILKFGSFRVQFYRK